MALPVDPRTELYRLNATKRLSLLQLHKQILDRQLVRLELGTERGDRQERALLHRAEDRYAESLSEAWRLTTWEFPQVYYQARSSLSVRGESADLESTPSLPAPAHKEIPQMNNTWDVRPLPSLSIDTTIPTPDDTPLGTPDTQLSLDFTLAPPSKSGHGASSSAMESSSSGSSGGYFGLDIGVRGRARWSVDSTGGASARSVVGAGEGKPDKEAQAQWVFALRLAARLVLVRRGSGGLSITKHRPVPGAATDDSLDGADGSASDLLARSSDPLPSLQSDKSVLSLPPHQSTSQPQVQTGWANTALSPDMGAAPLHLTHWSPLPLHPNVLAVSFSPYPSALPLTTGPSRTVPTVAQPLGRRSDSDSFTPCGRPMPAGAQRLEGMFLEVRPGAPRSFERVSGRLRVQDKSGSTGWGCCANERCVEMWKEKWERAEKEREEEEVRSTRAREAREDQDERERATVVAREGHSMPAAQTKDGERRKKLVKARPASAGSAPSGSWSSLSVSLSLSFAAVPQGSKVAQARKEGRLVGRLLRAAWNERNGALGVGRNARESRVSLV